MGKRIWLIVKTITFSPCGISFNKREDEKLFAIEGEKSGCLLHKLIMGPSLLPPYMNAIFLCKP